MDLFGLIFLLGLAGGVCLGWQAVVILRGQKRRHPNCSVSAPTAKPSTSGKPD